MKLTKHLVKNERNLMSFSCFSKVEDVTQTTKSNKKSNESKKDLTKTLKHYLRPRKKPSIKVKTRQSHEYK